MKTGRAAMFLVLISIFIVVLLGFTFLTGQGNVLKHRSRPVAPEAPKKADIPVPPDQSFSPPSMPSGHDDFDSVLWVALSETDLVRRGEMLGKWADSVRPENMEKMLLKLDASKDPALRTDACLALLDSWAERDPSGAIWWFGERYAADSLHQKARDVLVQVFAQRDPLQMVEWMQKGLPPVVARELYGPFFREWAGSDAEACGAKLSQLMQSAGESPSQWNDLVGQVAAVWANSDLNHAIRWVQSLPEGEAKSQALVQLSYQWTKQTPQAAAAYAMQRSDPKLVQVVAGKWAEDDPSSAAAWILGLPASEGRAAALGIASAIWAQRDPRAAAAYASALANSEERGLAMSRVASVWASSDPASAAKLSEQMPEGESQNQAIREVVTAWAGQNEADAANWLNQLPQGTRRDFAVGAFAGAVSSDHPGLAFKWAMAISDQSMRTEYLQNASRQWLAKDSETARTEISRSNLSFEVKRLLLPPDTEPVR